MPLGATDAVSPTTATTTPVPGAAASGRIQSSWTVPGVGVAPGESHKTTHVAARPFSTRVVAGLQVAPVSHAFAGCPRSHTDGAGGVAVAVGVFVGVGVIVGVGVLLGVDVGVFVGVGVIVGVCVAVGVSVGRGVGVTVGVGVIVGVSVTVGVLVGVGVFVGVFVGVDVGVGVSVGVLVAGAAAALNDPPASAWNVVALVE